VVRVSTWPGTCARLPRLALCGAIPGDRRGAAEQDTSLTGLSYDEVAAALRTYLVPRVPTDAVAALIDPQTLRLDARLERLERWHVVIRWQEPARTGEDFLRRRDRYQLTPIAARRSPAQLLVAS
jgi:hypothetical protein